MFFRKISFAVAVCAVTFAMPVTGFAQDKDDASVVPTPPWKGGSMWYGRGMGYGPGGWMMGGGMMRGVPGRGRFNMIDANEDGVVSAEEAASAADDVFSAMDADDDGMLTKDEYMAVRMGPGNGWNPARREARQKAKSERFGTMDKDKDGKVSKAEFMEGAKAHHEAADANGDGKVTPWEMRRRNWN